VLGLAQLYSSQSQPEQGSTAAATAAPEATAAGTPVFALDRLQQQLDDAKVDVARADADYQAALTATKQLAGRESDVAAQADSAALLSDRLLAQKAAVQLSLDSDSANAELDQLRTKL